MNLVQILKKKSPSLNLNLNPKLKFVFCLFLFFGGEFTQIPIKTFQNWWRFNDSWFSSKAAPKSKTPAVASKPVKVTKAPGPKSTTATKAKKKTPLQDKDDNLGFSDDEMNEVADEIGPLLSKPPPARLAPSAKSASQTYQKVRLQSWLDQEPSKQKTKKRWVHQVTHRSGLMMFLSFD